MLIRAPAVLVRKPVANLCPTIDCSVRHEGFVVQKRANMAKLIVKNVRRSIVLYLIGAYLITAFFELGHVVELPFEVLHIGRVVVVQVDEVLTKCSGRFKVIGVYERVRRCVALVLMVSRASNHWDDIGVE